MAGRAPPAPLARACNSLAPSKALRPAVPDVTDHEALPPASRPIPISRATDALCDLRDASHRKSSTDVVLINVSTHAQISIREGAGFPALPPSVSRPMLQSQARDKPCDSEDKDRLESSTHLVSEKEPSQSQDPIRRGTNLKTLTDLHITLRKAWEGSRQHLEFGTTITKAMNSNALQITSCLCLGLGSLSRKRDTHESSARHMSQLIAFETSIEMLKQKHTISQVFFQDPSFNPVDRVFLESRGYTILESPASNTHVNEQTYLFMPFVPFNVALATLRKCFPTLVLGQRFDEFAQAKSIGRLLETYTVLQRFVDLREKVSVPCYASEGRMYQRMTLYYPLP